MYRFIRANLILFAVLGAVVCFGQSTSGVFDLHDTDFTNREILLDGEWEFYWGQLLDPDQITLSQRDYLHVPQIWNGTSTKGGVVLENTGYATYRATVLLPPDHPDLAIFIKHVYSCYRLYINGQLASSGGEVGISESLSDPKWIPKVITLPETNRLELVLQVSNFRHSKGGIRESIVLASESHLDTNSNTILAFNLLLAGTLLMTSFFFYGLYFFGEREQASLFFALFCFAFSYRIVGADDYSLQVLFPGMSWLLMIKLEYLSLFIPPIFFALYTHTLFPLKFRFNLNLFYIFAGISVLFSLITILSPPYFFTTLVELYLICLLLGITLSGFTYIKAYRLRLDGSRYAILSSAIVLMIFLYKIFIYFGGGHEIEVVSFIGYLSFFFFQSLILFFIFTNSLKRSKEEAERASRAKSEFLSMMSHEIRTPMNAVIGLTNFLLEDKPKKGQVESLSTLKFSAENLLVIINDILDFSKIEANKIEIDPEPVNLRALIQRVRQVFLPMASKKGIDLLFIIDPKVPELVSCDQTRMSQILTNLISNAIKFTESGTVEVSLIVESQSDSKSTINFLVKDSGIGIPEDKLESIFHSFTQASATTTRQFGGTGLGLTITKKLLEIQNSKLKLTSVEGEGSTFYFNLEFDIIFNSTNEDLIKPPVKEKLKLDLKILLVEDNEVNVMVAMKFLKKWGMNVTVAKNGVLALECLESHSFHLILMDLQMPVMDGYEASKLIRSRGITTPIIALTASALLERQKKIHESGMDDYVTKPFDPDELLNKIRHFTH